MNIGQKVFILGFGLEGWIYQKIGATYSIGGEWGNAEAEEHELIPFPSTWFSIDT